MSEFVIPLTPKPQTFTITLSGVEYRLTIRWSEAIEGGWMLDLALAEGPDLVSGIAMVTGTDLLAPYPDLGLGRLWLSASDDLVPGFDDLGTSVLLIYETEANDV